MVWRWDRGGGAGGKKKTKAVAGESEEERKVRKKEIWEKSCDFGGALEKGRLKN